jgi:hypothetical protein
VGFVVMANLNMVSEFGFGPDSIPSSYSGGRFVVMANLNMVSEF